MFAAFIRGRRSAYLQHTHYISRAAALRWYFPSCVRWQSRTLLHFGEKLFVHEKTFKMTTHCFLQIGGADDPANR